eukprot:ctg_2388.g339
MRRSSLCAPQAVSDPLARRSDPLCAPPPRARLRQRGPPARCENDRGRRPPCPSLARSPLRPSHCLRWETVQHGVLRLAIVRLDWVGLVGVPGFVVGVGTLWATLANRLGTDTAQQLGLGDPGIAVLFHHGGVWRAVVTASHVEGRAGRTVCRVDDVVVGGMLAGALCEPRVCVPVADARRLQTDHLGGGEHRHIVLRVQHLLERVRAVRARGGGAQRTWCGCQFGDGRGDVGRRLGGELSQRRHHAAAASGAR